MITDDTKHYFNLLMSLDCSLHHLREALADHKDCPGCELCWDCQGVEYTLKIYFDTFRCLAPYEAVEEFRRETDPDEIKREVEQLRLASAVTLPIVPASAAASELPSAKNKPYWLS